MRNILQRPKPRNTPKTPAATAEKTEEKPEASSIPASYPNHIWSVDTTKARCRGLGTIQVLVAIDHFSRKVVCVAPLEGPNADWIIEALEQAMRIHGGPKHIISDQAPVFVGDAFAELLNQWNIKPRFGAIGKHGSIAVTERVIKTLKYEWLRCVPIIKGFDHLTSLCTEFENWYNRWRPHMTLEGFRPDDAYYKREPESPKRNAKTVPGDTSVTSSPRHGSLPIASRPPRSPRSLAPAFSPCAESAHFPNDKCCLPFLGISNSFEPPYAGPRLALSRKFTVTVNAVASGRHAPEVA